MAIVAAAREVPEPHFLSHIAMGTLVDPRFRRSGAATMFLGHILQDHSTKGTRIWENASVGIINVLSGIYQSESEVRDAAILQEIHSSYRGILDVFWKNFSTLTQVGVTADSRRAIVAKLFHHFLCDPGMKQTMYDERTAKIVLQCWLGTAPDSPVRKNVAITVDLMFTPYDHLENSPPIGYLRLASNSYKITTFISQVNYALKHKKMVGETLLREVSTLRKFIALDEPFFPHIVEGGVHRQYAAAARRHLKNGDSDIITQELLEESGLFMQLLLDQASNTMALFTELLANTCLAEIGAVALKLANRSYSNAAVPWYIIFENIKHSMTCNDFDECKYHATPSFLEAARTSLERLAIPTVIALQEEVVVGGERKYLDQWTQVIRLLGITDKSIRERYRVDRKCCNLGCPARNSGSPSPKKSTCMECRSVFYCDYACQKSDWINHKAECEMLAQTQEEDPA
ncbi:hypothetical protein GALMADRAFT_242864 [Galerina marginata CBS 339.88]|uniref:MYND-type domain-containing protein n=1 Tax=Galerina marginata (strain CBS 339.88) TaxID=685588 RepID=A0A067TNB9_GALM3|nr:hypothetical protein GALMADRAFT_242864 [Galerina marginata CBS 339.88]